MHETTPKDLEDLSQRDDIYTSNNYEKTGSTVFIHLQVLTLYSSNPTVFLSPFEIND